MKKKLLAIIILSTFCGICLFSISSSCPLFHFGIIESLTSGDRLEDIRIPYSQHVTQTVEQNTDPRTLYHNLQRTSNFQYDGVQYSYTFTLQLYAHIVCCGRRGTGTDDCAAWAPDTSKERCPYYYTIDYNWAAWWD